MTAVAVIPARYASSRFPGKPVARRTGKFLIEHVYEQAQQAKSINRVIVATDDMRIADAVRSFGGESVMTRADHICGTDRVAEVARGLDCDLVLNVQGDEPELDPGQIDQLVERMAEDSAVPIGTLACPFAVLKSADPNDPNAVKVVVDGHRRALYFSRAMIPYPRTHESTGRTHQPAPYLLHLGLYAFRRQILATLSELPPTPLERTECLEQLRWLEHGHSIAVNIVDRAAVGIDTPADYDAFVKRFMDQRSTLQAARSPSSTHRQRLSP